MNLTHLRFASTVAETGSFSKAAEICHITQPALSNAIAVLESSLGGKLFDRTTRTVVLTAFGRQILPAIREALNSEAHLYQTAESFFSPKHKMVRIGLSPLANINVLKEMLAPYEEAEPDTTLLYKECFLDNIQERLFTEQIDVAIRPYASDLEITSSVVDLEIYSECLVVMLPPKTSGLANKTVVEIGELKDQTFILTADLCGLARITQTMFQQNGLPIKSYPGQPLSYQVMAEWAEIGMGAAILPISKVAGQHRSHVLPIVDADGEFIYVRYAALWKAGNDIPPHIEKFRRHLKQSTSVSIGQQGVVHIERNAV